MDLPCAVRDGDPGGLSYPLYPTDAGDRIILEVTQFVDAACERIPHVHGAAETDAQNIAATPIHQVEVKVVLEVGGVKYFVGDLVHVARLPAGSLQNALAVVTDGR